MKKINQIAKEQGEEVATREGGKHTVVSVGDKRTTVPRHTEINERTAQSIIKYLEGTGK